MCLYNIQRVALIRTLAIKPDILLLDEPTSGLDSQSRLKVDNDVYNIIKNEKKSTIIVTHNIEEAIIMSDRVIVLSDRPSSIKKIIDINFDNNISPIERRESLEFNNYYKEIWESIDTNV